MKTKLQALSNWIRWLTDWRPVKRAAATSLLLVSILAGLTYASHTSYKIGQEHGLRQGQCELGCAFLDMEYAFYDESWACWCQSSPNSYYTVPVRRNF
mgnify:FL=1